MKDLFEEYLSKNDLPNIKRALTASSRKQMDHTLNNKDVADDLATLGDAVIKLCYAKYFLDKCEKLSQKIEKYITDEVFVTKIANHYELLKNIAYDKNDKKIPCDYNYEKPKRTSGKNKKQSRHKYIATAVEAMIGAIYLETKDLKRITELLLTWTKYIEN